HVLVAYKFEDAGRYAVRQAIDIAEALVKNVPYNINDDINYLQRLAPRERLGPSTAFIVEEAKARGIPVKRDKISSSVTLGYGYKQKKITATMTSTTSGMAINLVKDKHNTKLLLEEAHVPVPHGVLVYD